MTSTLVEDADISYALVCLKTGAMLESLDPAAPTARMQDLASATPELFQAGAPADFGAFFTRLGSEQKRTSFQEIVFMSAQNAHVVQRLSHRPDVALVAVSVDAKKLGLMLSGVRARMLRLESTS